jgi:hypothetical protein
MGSYQKKQAKARLVARQKVIKARTAPSKVMGTGTKSPQEIRRAFDREIRHDLPERKPSTGRHRKRGRQSVKAKRASEKYKRSNTRLKKIQKRGFITPQAISSRYKAHLTDPGKPFSIPVTDEAPWRQRERAGHGLLSTAIVSFSYHPEEKLLFITFWKDWKKRIEGATYVYFNISFDTYTQFVRASSKGRYFYYFIRSVYQFQRLK